MRMLTGTTGYSYKEWVGPFYPEKTPASGMLRYYAQRLPTVEINNTFYRMPAPALVERWAADVPEGFLFALKASRFITHIKRLKEVESSVGEFLRRAAFLGDKLGILLFQLPPFMKKDLARLRDLLAALPPERRVAVEFRHDSWHDDEVYEELGERGAALCIMEDDEGASPFVGTSKETYLRLRRTQYTESDLRAWADRIAAQSLERAWVYFKHEDEALAPRWAQELAEIVGRPIGRSGPGAPGPKDSGR